MPAKAIPCPCKDDVCKNWLVEPQAAFQGVSFTLAEAKAVAITLNRMEEQMKVALPDITCLHEGEQGEVCEGPVMKIAGPRGPGNRWIRVRCIVDPEHEFEVQR